ncbi:MAG: lactate utilization protein [Oscillospiraceae bacterium]|nr:lactate utilization protein [Oscillospiraceae bacterium]
MEQNLQKVIEKRIERTMESLRKNRMDAYFVKTKEEVVPLIESLCKEGENVAAGGSVTLAECGVMDHLRSGRYNFWDRYAPGVDSTEMMRKAFFADSYFASSNAITEEGELYNVDGNGNRVAAMIYGPSQVIVVAGYNKIVADMGEAVTRLEKIASPANVMRLDLPAPCKITGQCMNCRSEGRICCQFVKMGFQRNAGRVKVILVGEELGY